MESDSDPDADAACERCLHDVRVERLKDIERRVAEKSRRTHNRHERRIQLLHYRLRQRHGDKATASSESSADSLQECAQTAGQSAHSSRQRMKTKFGDVTVIEFPAEQVRGNDSSGDAAESDTELAEMKARWSRRVVSAWPISRAARQLQPATDAGIATGVSACGPTQQPPLYCRPQPQTLVLEPVSSLGSEQASGPPTLEPPPSRP